MKFKFYFLKYKLEDFQKCILLIFVLLGILILFILNVLLQNADSYMDKLLPIINNDCGNDYNCKINIIESLIKSSENNIECKIPDLPIDTPELMKFYNTEAKTVQCSDNENWIQCVKSYCTIKESIRLKEGKITCVFEDINRKNENKIEFDQSWPTGGNYTLKGSDFIKVLCRSTNGGMWQGLGVGIREIPIRKSKTNLKLYNVLIFGFDSLSRNAFIRILPKTYEYLTKKLKANVLRGYNIVGDGTQQALIPILTGKKELELPEIRRQVKGSGNADLYPIIWKDYKKFGYVTSFNEDLSGLGTFSYRLNGFKNQPTDHYMRTMYVAARKYLTNKFCINNKMHHVLMLDYIKNLLAQYENIAPSFTFSFHGAVSHNSLDSIHNTDDDIFQWLVNLNDNRLLKNTILILMSDHGNRFHEDRNTVQGKQEERLPFFSFTFPKSFKRQHPKAFKNFQQNINLLTTPFDIHETLLDLLRLQNLNITPTFNKHQQKTPPRGISLFQVIPKNRSCSMAYIEPHWCSCLKWHKLNASDKLVSKLAEVVVNKINNYTNYFRNICEYFPSFKVNWAIKVSPNDHLVRFKKTKDIDGFLADMSSELAIKIDMYRIQIIVKPGFLIFEATLTHDPSNKKIIVHMSQISRNVEKLNRTGGQGKCTLYNLHLYPDLTDYCYCKTL